MAITTLDGIIAGLKPPVPVCKTGIAASAVGAMRGYTPWYAAGNPGAATANAVGINGAAVVGPVAGQIPRNNPSGGQSAYVARLSMQTSITGSLWLIDRLWNNSGLSVTLTSAQVITPAALPARDSNGATLGENVMAAIEWSAIGGLGAPAVTLSYTDSAGNAANTATLTGVATPPVGTFEIFTLAAGDTGIRSVESLTQSATRTSGTMHLVLFRVLAQLHVTTANLGDAIDSLTGGRPIVYDNSALQLVWFPTATTAATFIGTYQEAHG